MISHIGVAVHDLESAIRHWEQAFGFKVTHRIDIEAEGVHTAMLSPTGEPGGMSVELMEPIDRNDSSNVVVRHLAERGEGFFHLAMIVDDLQAEETRLGNLGIKAIERPPTQMGAALADIVDSDSRRWILHPKCSNGILIELLQRKAG